MPSLFSEILTIINIVVPTAVGNGLEYLPVLIGMALVGHSQSPNTKDELDALSLGRTFFNFVAMAPGFGLISALRTLCPQAVGAGQPRLNALYLQRAFLLVILWIGPVTVCALYAERILLLVGQPPEASRLAQPYVLRLLPTYFGVVGMSAIQRIYQAENKNYANLVIVAITFCTAPPLQWLLINRLGYLGAAWASSAYNNVYFLLQIPHLCYLGRGYLFVPRMATLSKRGLYEYVRLMIPGFLMCCMEWWVLEALVFLAGRLHHADVAIAAFTLTSQVQAMGLMAWIGLGVASSSLVGQRIGAADLVGARRAALITPLVGFALAALLGVAVALLAPQIADGFAKAAKIDNLVSRLLPLVAGVMVVDALSNSLQGVCSGLGLQRVAAYGQVVGYYIVGLPAACALAYGLLHDSEDGAFGLWGGVGLAMLTAAVMQVVALVRHDWSQSVKEAQRRLEAEAAGVSTATSVNDTTVVVAAEGLGDGLLGYSVAD